ncbi:MAG: IS66 family transposase [Terriglobia bacterium]
MLLRQTRPASATTTKRRTCGWSGTCTRSTPADTAIREYSRRGGQSILPKSNASASLLAHLATLKFDDGQPLYPVCRQLDRRQVRLSPGTVGTRVNILASETVVPPGVAPMRPDRLQVAEGCG